MKSLLFRVVPPAIVLLLFIAAGEIIVRAFNIPKYLLPRPSAVLLTMLDDREDLLNGLLTTGEGAVLGFAASALVGSIAAIVLSTSKWVRLAFYPYTVFFQTVPLVAIAPLLKVWAGPGLQSVVICVLVVSVFPIIANTLTGLLSTDPALSDLFTLYEARPVARLWKLKIPSALPSIFSGLRVASGLAVIGAVVAELFVGEIGEFEGLGVKMRNAADNARPDRVFAAVLLASLLGLAIFAAVNAIGWLCLRRWHASERET